MPEIEQPDPNDPFEEWLFPLGRLQGTDKAAAILASARVDPSCLFEKHAAGVWGDLSREDRWANDDNLKTGGQLLSAYVVPPGVKVWVVTDASRESTTIMLPEEY